MEETNNIDKIISDLASNYKDDKNVLNEIFIDIVNNRNTTPVNISNSK